MCGISGIFELTGRPIDEAALQRMTSILQHRGPDGEGRFIDGEVGLGHRRLSIIDVEGGAQPIGNEDGSLQIVFNGEIYNFVELRKELEAVGHKFKTRSDTEVIVHAYEQWGKECVRRFNGMFAFALWDSIRRELFLARDHLGIKPLYYINLGNRILFGSEIKALLQYPDCPREVDLEALGELFTFRYVPSPRTLFKGIQKLPPGYRMVLSPRGIEVERFWNWIPRLREECDVAALIEEYQSLLEDAVRLQLRSDVPVGLFLSSGIDSGVLLAIMSKYSSGAVQAFTIGFEGGEKTNEVEDARSLARMFGADHHFMMVKPEDYLKYYENYLWDLEEPVGNETAAAFHFVSKLASKEVKVTLTGQGADEPWAGYHRYIGVKLSKIYEKFPSFMTKGLKKIAQIIPRNERFKRGVLSLDEKDILSRFVKIYSFYSEEMKSALFQDWVKKELALNGYEAKKALRILYKDVRYYDPLTQMLYIDTRMSLPDDLLMVNDKTSMANSIEVRVPFLDYRLVEFIESLPPRLKLNGLTGKYLHKKALEKWLPKQRIYKKKKGFDNPIHKWLRKEMKPFLDDCLLSEYSAVKQFFDANYVKQMIQLHESGKEQYLRHIYLLMSFELWYRRFLR